MPCKVMLPHLAAGVKDVVRTEDAVQSNATASCCRCEGRSEGVRGRIKECARILLGDGRIESGRCRTNACNRI